MSKNKTKFGFLFKLAFRNIMSHKRHMFIIIFGFTISVSLLITVNTWSQTSEKLAINDFLETQDFQAYIFSAQRPEEISDIQDDLDENPLVDIHTTAYATAALFNTEGKSSSYQCLPEESQANPSDPVSITNAFVADQLTLQRISFMFNVEGNFTVEDNGIILSLYQAQELSDIYGYDLTIGDQINVSIAKNSPNPAYGQDRLENFDLTFYESYTIKGIYTVREGTSILQSAVDVDWLSDSIIFPINSLSSSDTEAMTTNDIPYLLFVKFDKEEITKDGLSNVIDKMELFSEEIKNDYPTMFIYTLEGTLQNLINAYSRASFTIVFMIPAILIGVVMTVFTINVVIKSREAEVALLRDRGAMTIQIVLLFIIEFLIVALIGIVIGIGISIPFSALIPSFGSNGFSLATFTNFIQNISIQFGFVTIVSLVLILVLVGYASIKIWWEISLRHKSSEHELSARRKIERNVITGVAIGIATINVLALLFSLVNTLRLVRDSNNFTFASTSSAGYTFILFCVLLIFLSQVISLFLSNRFHVKIKGFLKRLVFTDAFFLHNNFKRKDKKLSTMTFALVIVSSVIVFSLIAASSVTMNQEIEADFKNGADIRVVTYPLDYSFRDDIKQVDGINEVCSIHKTVGSIAYTDYTVYGVDPIIYSRVGKWDDSCFPEGYSFNNLQDLDETSNGIIISKELSERLNITIGDNVPISNLPGGVYSRSFSIVGIINSAPGLGLAQGRNVELLQQNEGFVIINDQYMINELEVVTSQLFFASVLPDSNIDPIATEVENLLSNIQVNPELVNEQFIGAFIESYIPNVTVFFWIELMVTVLIVIILLITFTEFILSQRTQEYAIKLSMGGSRWMISKLLLAEIAIIVLSASIGGILLGLGFTYSTFHLITPLLTSHNLIPFTIHIPIVQIIVFPIILTMISLIGVLPSIIKQGKQKIITALRS